MRLQSTDSNLSELADAFLTTVDAELESDTSLPGFVQAAKEAIAEHRFRDDAFVVLDPDGRIVITSEDLTGDGGPRREFPREVFGSKSFQKLASSAGQGTRTFGDVEGGRDGYRGVVRRFAVGSKEFTLVVLQSLHRQQEVFEGIVGTFAVVIPLRGGAGHGRWIFSCEKKLGAGGGHEHASREDQRFEPARTAEDPERERRAGAFGKVIQRVAGPAGCFVRAAAPVYGRRFARVAHAGSDFARRSGSVVVARGPVAGQSTGNRWRLCRPKRGGCRTSWKICSRWRARMPGSTRW